MHQIDRRRFSTNMLAACCGVAVNQHPAFAIDAVGASDQTTKFDLLNDGLLRWLPGAKLKSDGWWVNHRGFEISEQEGSPGVENPVINLAGGHFSFDGELSVELELSSQAGEAVLHLCGQPPIVYDEFVYNRGMLRIAIEEDSLWCGLIEPNGDQSWAVERHAAIDDATTHMIRVEIKPEAQSMTIKLDDQSNVMLPTSGLFKSNELWWGLEANGESAEFRIDRFMLNAKQATASSLSSMSNSETSNSKTMRHPIASIPDSDNDETGLQALVDSQYKGFTIGAAVALAPLACDQRYRQLFGRGMIGSVTTENAMKAQFIHPLRDTFDFAESDAIVRHFTNQDIRIHGHALVFGEANPQWMRRLATAHPDQMMDVMTQHIDTVVSHFGQDVSSWDVVNEPLADYDTQPGPVGLRQHLWLRSCGKQYIKAAFQTASHANPTAQLFINEFGLEEGGDRWKTMRNLLRKLLDSGVPVHGVGFQSHVYNIGDEVVRDQFHGVLDEVAQMGLVARVSELDVHGDRGPNVQADQFATVLQACLDHPACNSLSFWGLTDKYGSTSYLDDGKLQYGSGLPWDKNVRPRPAMQAMRDALTDEP